MKNKELQLVKFEAEGHVYPMSIHDAEGNRWITSQEVADALGITNSRKLVAGLIATGELREGIHYCNLKLQMVGDTQTRKYMVLSYRGIIRVAMRSDGKRAPVFRDWAEDVLYEVMTTGSYLAGEARGMPIALVEDKARAEGIRRGLGLTVLRERYGISSEEIVDYCWYRHLGMTHAQCAKLME